MTLTTELCDTIRARLNDLFGPPRHPAGRTSWKSQWTIRVSPRRGDIHLLLEPNNDLSFPLDPVIWVFDPSEADHGVLYRAIESEKQMEEMIALIKERILSHSDPGIL